MARAQDAGAPGRSSRTSTPPGATRAVEKQARSVGPGTRVLVLLALIAALTLGLALPAAAAELESSELIIITEETVVTGDLYAVANRVLVRGRIEGDLIAVAGQDISIEGEVTGSVNAMAAEVNVSGTIRGSLRVTSPALKVSGEVSGDIVAIALDVEVDRGARIGGDLVMWAWGAATAGTVAGDVAGTQRGLEISGEVGGNVSVTSGQVTVSDELQVGRDFTYRSEAEAKGLELAAVEGAVVRQTPLPPNIRVRALLLAGKILVAILLSAMALIIASQWPIRSERALESLTASPLRSLATGLAVLLSPLLVVAAGVAIFAFAPSSTALPLVAALIPVLFALMGVVLVASLVAGVPAVAWIGSRIKRQTTVAGAVGIGSVVVGVLWLIPVVGWVAAALVLATGLGGWLSTLRRTESDAEPG